MIVYTALTFLLLHTTLSASESDLKSTSETTGLTIHVPPTYDSHLSKPLLDDQENKIAHSSVVIETKEKEKLPDDLPEDGFVAELFPGIPSLRQLATEATEAERKKNQAYSNLYKTLLTHLLPHYTIGTAPEEVSQVKPVGDPDSYTVSVDYHNEAHLAGLPLLLLSIHEPYRVRVPLPRPGLELSLKNRAPRTLKKALGAMGPELADFISYRKAHRTIHKNKLQKTAYSLLLASWIGTTAYWMYFDTQHNVSSGKMAGHFFVDFFAHLIGGPIAAIYPIEVIMAHYKRIDQRKAHIQAATELPVVADMDPQVDCLAEDYISNKLLRDIDILKSRQWCCWLLCCPVFDGIQRLLQKPLRDASELERIHSILNISHTRLTGKLLEEQHGENAAKLAAQRIQNTYSTMLTSMYQLNPQNLATIIEQSVDNFDLTPRRQRFLRQTILNARRALNACMPQPIRALARSEG